MKRQWIIGMVIALCAAPMAVGLSGCNGGNGSGGPSTATPTPTIVGSQNFTAPVNFGNGQTGTLTLTTQGSIATGTLKVNARHTANAPGAAAAQSASADAFTFAIPIGTYNLRGTFIPPRGFNVIGNLPNIGQVRINGMIPTQTQSSAFTVAIAGQSTSGTFAALNTLATPTPIRPDATPTSSPVGQ